MAKIFKPRRAKKTTVTGSGAKASLVLAAGELMVASRGTSIGGSNKHDIYIGDGATQIKNLSPALYGDTSDEDITITANTGTYEQAYNAAVSGVKLSVILGALKQAINKLNDDKSPINHTHSGYAPVTHNHDELYWKRTETISNCASATVAEQVPWSGIQNKPSTYTAGNGTATYVLWSNVASKPSVFPPESHSHSEYVVKNSIGDLQALQMYSSTPFVDFHYQNSSGNYTSRIIDDGTLKLLSSNIIAESSGNITLRAEHVYAGTAANQSEVLTKKTFNYDANTKTLYINN